MAKFIKLIALSAASAQQAANKFLSDNDVTPEFIEARPFEYCGDNGKEPGALVCIQYEADEPIVETATTAEGE